MNNETMTHSDALTLLGYVQENIQNALKDMPDIESIIKILPDNVVVGSEVVEDLSMPKEDAFKYFRVLKEALENANADLGEVRTAIKSMKAMTERYE